MNKSTRIKIGLAGVGLLVIALTVVFSIYGSSMHMAPAELPTEFMSI